MVIREIEQYMVLNDEQRKEVCEELARLVFEVKKDKHVECIYFTTLKNFNVLNGNVLEVTIVEKDSNISEEEYSWENYNNLHQEEKMLKRFGVKFYVDIDSSENYTLLPQNPTESNRWYVLLNSTILFDGTGEYKKIQEKVENDVRFASYYSNMASIEPSIMDEVNKLIEEYKMQEETETVRKFTVTVQSRERVKKKKMTLF